MSLEMSQITPEEVFGDLYRRRGKAGARLFGVRCRENINQIEMAKKLKVSQSRLSGMENGRYPISEDVKKTVKDVFEVDLP